MAQEYTIKVKADTGQAVNNIEDVNESLKKTSETSQELSSGLDTATGGAITKFKGLKTTILGVTKSFKTLRGAIIATGIGALIVSITAVTAAFNSSEEGQNRFAKILKQLGVIAGNVGDIFSSLGTVILETLSGNFDAAGDAFDQLKERVLNFGDETRKELELAGDLADKISEANKRERELLVERAKTNVEINKLKTKAAEVDKFTAEERIKFLELAAAKEDEITKKEVALATLRRDIKIEENSLSESTKEDLDEEAQLVANVIQLEEQRLIRNKELLGVAAGLRKTEADAKAAERAAELAAIQKQSNDINQIKADSNEKQKIAIASLDQLKERASRNEIKNDLATSKMKLAVAGNTLMQVSQLVGEGSAIGKAAALASATISGIEGVQNAYSSAQKSPITVFFPAFPIVQAGLAAAFSAKQIKSIASTSPSSASGGASIGASVSGGSSGAPTATPQAPDFNVVGAGATNQLADAISGQQAKPQKAYVVSNDVTTAQSLDRNIVEGASI